MARRNFTLLIIVLIIILIVVFGFWYFRQIPSAPGSDTGGINFFSNFNPFGKKPLSPPAEPTPPTDVSGFKPAEEIPVTTTAPEKTGTSP